MPYTVRDETPEQRLEYFREAAKRTREEAARETKADYKLALLQLADSWDRLVAHTEKEIDAARARPLK
jgi:F0F1-type ATP synthase membrane subunit b/b'